MYSFIDQWFRLPPESAHLAFTFTKPPFRGRGLAKITYTNLLEELRRQEVEVIFLEIEPDNTPSIRAAAGCGFEKYLTLKYFRLVVPRFYFVRLPDGRHARRVRLLKTEDSRMDALLFGNAPKHQEGG